MYNQCANLMLRYAIKLHEGHATEVPKQLLNGKEAVPPPPMPGDIKVVAVGLPWQVSFLYFLYVDINLISTIASHIRLSTCSRRQTT